jgi:hypothetical protein
MNFKDQLNTLISFLSDNYKKHLPPYISAPEITTEFIDFDKFKGNFTMFADFSRIVPGQSGYKDDCRDAERLSLVIYLVHRNNQSQVLNDNNLDAAWAFYELLAENPGLGIAQNTVVDSIDFYKYVEGTKYLVCAEINLSLDVEL